MSLSPVRSRSSTNSRRSGRSAVNSTPFTTKSIVMICFAIASGRIPSIRNITLCGSRALSICAIGGRAWMAATAACTHPTSSPAYHDPVRLLQSSHSRLNPKPPCWIVCRRRRPSEFRSSQCLSPRTTSFSALNAALGGTCSNESGRSRRHRWQVPTVDVARLRGTPKCYMCCGGEIGDDGQTPHSGDARCAFGPGWVRTRSTRRRLDRRLSDGVSSRCPGARDA